jgi:hypothetical protein
MTTKRKTVKRAPRVTTHPLIFEARSVKHVASLWNAYAAATQAGLRVVLELWGTWPSTGGNGGVDPMPARSDGLPRRALLVANDVIDPEFSATTPVGGHVELWTLGVTGRLRNRLFPERLWRDPAEERLYSGVAVLRELHEDEPWTPPRALDEDP